MLFCYIVFTESVSSMRASSLTMVIKCLPIYIFEPHSVVGDTDVMRTFILVHGTWGGGWQWRDVADRLRAKGNTVFTPTLTGLGEREHLISRDANLEMHINDIAAVIRYEKLETVVLVGTSYAGLVISGVADRLSHRITTLIYLNAALPVNGKSMLDTLPEERRNTVKRLAGVEGDGYRVPTSLVLDTGIEDNDRRDDFLRRMTPHPLRVTAPTHSFMREVRASSTQGIRARDEKDITSFSRAL